VGRRNLTDEGVDRLPVKAKKYEEWDKLDGLCVRVEASGRKTFYFVYTFNRRVRWYRIGPAALGMKAARIMVKELWGDVVRGRDPQTERTSQRMSGITFAQLHQRYLEEWAKKKNKSWTQANSLIIAHVLRPWGNLNATEIKRSHVKALFGKLSVDTPPLANSVKAAISAVFTFGVDQEVVAANPCDGIEANKTNARERVLSETETAAFWNACDEVNPVRAAALRAILLTGQRPGEISHMRHEHIKDGWWEMPGEPVPELGWPGTKSGSSHRVFLSAKVRELIAELGDDEGFVFDVTDLAATMRQISNVAKLVPPVTPHDLRRSAGTLITGRGYGREAMDRILGHRRKSVGDVYDRHDYAAVDKVIMEDLATAVTNAVEGKKRGNVVAARFRKAL
jgi:integrase